MTAVIAIAVILLAAAFPALASPAGNSEVVARALTMPFSDALRTLELLSRSQSEPVRVRAQSLRVLGDYQFAKEDYRKAADLYRQALALDNQSAYKELYELSVTMAGDKVDLPALPSTPPASTPSTAATVSTPPAVSTPSTPSTPPSTPSTATTVSTPSTPSAPSAVAAGFTVQVGAFGSKDNADNLAKKLSGTYGGVTVSPVTRNGQSLYRVWVGTFSRREDASALAGRLTAEAGLSTTAIVER